MTVFLIFLLQSCLRDPCIYMDALIGYYPGTGHHSAHHVTADAPQRNPAGYYRKFNIKIILTFLFLAFYFVCLCYTHETHFDINSYNSYKMLFCVLCSLLLHCCSFVRLMKSGNCYLYTFLFIGL